MNRLSLIGPGVSSGLFHGDRRSLERPNPEAVRPALGVRWAFAFKIAEKRSPGIPRAPFSGRCTREGSAAAAPTKQDDDNEKNPDPACVGAAESQTVAAAASAPAPAVAVVANRYASTSTSTVTVVHHD